MAERQEDERLGLVDRLGTGLTVAIIATLVSASAIGAVALRDLVVASDVELKHLKSDIERLRNDLESFRAPGGRFTAADGARHDQRITALEQTVGRCNERAVRIETQIEQMHKEHEGLRRSDR